MSTVHLDSGAMVRPALANTSAPTLTDNQHSPLSIDTSDAGLRVHVQNGGSGGTSATDEAAWTAGSSTFTPSGGVFNDSAASLTSGQEGTFRATASRAIHTNVRNAAGTEILTSTNPGRIDPTGTTTQPISAVSLPLPTGAATLAKQPALGTAGTASADVISIQGIASMTAVKIDGSAVNQPVTGAGAAGASVAGNPVRLGALGRTTVPTVVSSAQLVDILADRFGRLFQVAPVCTVVGSNASAISTATTTSIVAAPSAGNHLRVHRLWAQNYGTGTVLGYWCDGTTKRIPFYLASGQPFSMAMGGRWELATATALQIVTTTVTGTVSMEWYVEYETLTD